MLGIDIDTEMRPEELDIERVAEDGQQRGSEALRLDVVVERDGRVVDLLEGLGQRRRRDVRGLLVVDEHLEGRPGVLDAR